MAERMVQCVKFGREMPGLDEAPWPRPCNFNLYVPQRTQDRGPCSRNARIQRMLGGVVSVLSLGIGLAWGLLDEEHLTWHDHISRTFPAARE